MPKYEEETHDDDYCPETEDHNHVPDWESVHVDSDGGEYYIDVTCSACGRSGCLGTAKTLADNISW